MPVTVTRETLGPVAGAPSLVLLRATQLIDSPEAAQAVRALVTGTSERVGGAPLPTDAVGSLRRETIVTVALDPARARPHRVRFEQRSAVDDQRRTETRDTTFDWSKATGCGS